MIVANPSFLFATSPAGVNLTDRIVASASELSFMFVILADSDSNLENTPLYIHILIFNIRNRRVATIGNRQSAKNEGMFTSLYISLLTRSN